MQRRKVIRLGLIALGGMVLFLSLRSGVLADTPCDWLETTCGTSVNTTGCWDENCDNCDYGCSNPTCQGGYGCYPAPSCSGSTPCGIYPNCTAKTHPTNCQCGYISDCYGGSCSKCNCANYDLCGGLVDSLYECTPPGCWDCASGDCDVPTCDGGDESCVPISTDIYCSNYSSKPCGGQQPSYAYCTETYCDEVRCPWGCVTNSCEGGTCVDPNDLTGVGCFEAGIRTCVNDRQYVCNDLLKLEVEESFCAFGCNEAGEICNHEEYCEDLDCSESTCPNENDYRIVCWLNSKKERVVDSEGNQIYPREECVSGTACSLGECHSVSETCGGTLTVERCNELYPGMGYVSHIDNCGGMDCGLPCGDGCVPEYPTKPELSLPVDGGVTGTTVVLDWSESGYGVGCPENVNSQDLYLEAGDDSPDVKIADLASGVSSYEVSGLEEGTVYYWKVMVSNGSLSMNSDVYSFNVNGLIEGYLFDSSGMSVCPVDLSDPAYDSLKIGGGLLDITGTADYLNVTSLSDGSYSQAVTVPSSYVLGNFRLGAGFVATPDLICDGSSVEFVVGGSGTAIRSFGFLRDYDGWWQGVGGDVYGRLGMASTIPGSCVGDCQAYLIGSDGNGESGLLHHTSGSVDLGDNEEAAVGADGWVAQSGYGGQNVSYAYYVSKMALLDKTGWLGSGKPVFNPEIGSDFEIYALSGNGTIDFDVSAGEKMIFMVDGDVDVSSDVDVAVGGHLAVIASGRITFESGASQVEGWWVGDSLSIESTGDEATELQFRGEGSFVGWNGVSLNRDRGGLNATEPAEVFVHRADLMINAPDALKFSRYVWQEKAPN